MLYNSVPCKICGCVTDRLTKVAAGFYWGECIQCGEKSTMNINEITSKYSNKKIEEFIKELF